MYIPNLPLILSTITITIFNKPTSIPVATYPSHYSNTTTSSATFQTAHVNPQLAAPTNLPNASPARSSFSPQPPCLIPQMSHSNLGSTSASIIQPAVPSELLSAPEVVPRAAQDPDITHAPAEWNIIDDVPAEWDSMDAAPADGDVMGAASADGDVMDGAPASLDSMNAAPAEIIDGAPAECAECY